VLPTLSVVPTAGLFFGDLLKQHRSGAGGVLKRVIVYLLLFLSGLVYLAAIDARGGLPAWLEPLKLGFRCIIAGGVGGCVYCLRAVYLNASVRRQWDATWLPWYFIRPIVSTLCGALAFLFLSAGLLVLEADIKPQGSDLGFLALAFIAGLNVDRFVSKLEDIAHATWGIEKSRTSQGTKEESKQPDV
jgi:hypothetical protein